MGVLEIGVDLTREGLDEAVLGGMAMMSDEEQTGVEVRRI